MIKLLWSTFAMSLIFFSSPSRGQLESIDDFSGTETELLPDLKGLQRFSPTNLHEEKDWNVSDQKVIQETLPHKGQGHSLIPWKTLEPEEWLSYERWLDQRNAKDKNSDWKLILRHETQHELMGKILQCQGKCFVFKESHSNQVDYLSRITEGDEIKTEKDSVAWVYMIDGTLLRIGPNSSVSLLEINWSSPEVFHLVRLNEGHIFWHPRNKQVFPAELSPETDPFSLPLMLREANQAFFERELFKSQNDFERTQEMMNLEEKAIEFQIAKINELKLLNNNLKNPTTKMMLVTPNATLVSKYNSLDVLYYPGGKTLFKKRNKNDEDELILQLRGFSDMTDHPIKDETWYEVEVNGRDFSQVEKISGHMEITELITRRIKTLELARELWFGKFTFPIIESLADPHQLAIKHGYKLWGEDFKKRFSFLSESIRRQETINLRSIQNIFEKKSSLGRAQPKEISDEHYQAALNYYLLSLKLRYSSKRLQVREMNDLQYYVWILNHGKRKN